MTKDQVVDEFAKIPGMSRKAAEALYAAGIHSLEDLEKAQRDRLKEVEGVGPKTLKAIQAWQAEQRGEAPSEKQEIQVVEERKPKEKERKAKEEVRIVEPEEREHKARAKPTLSAELDRALHLRRVLNKHRPTHRHDQWFRYPRFAKAPWRLPRGARNKVRSDFVYRGRRPVVGYRGPVLARGLHSSGFAEVLVHRPADLEGIDPATHAARIGASVGTRKREAIMKAAETKGIRILNPLGAGQ